MYSDQLIKQNDFILWLALKHHITHKKTRLDFQNHAYQKAIYVDKSPYIIIKKSTQCLTPDTLIIVDNGYKKISEIKVGDYVLTHKGRYRKVTKINKRKIDEKILKIKSTNNSWLKITKNHSVYYTEYNQLKIPKWIKAKNIKIGGYLYSRYLMPYKIIKIDEYNYNGYVYNFSVDEDESYVANDVIVHNCGLTEFLIVRSIGKAITGQSIFYVLPTYQLVNRFVRNRVDKTINSTPYYKGLEKLAKEQDSYKRSESMTLKDIGNGTIAYTGSNSTASFTEFPADDIIIDELDECDQENIEMAWERMSHSEYRTQIKIANPTIEGYGIDKEFARTNQMEWHIKHSCGNYITFDWFKQVVEEIENNLYRIRDQKWDWNSNRDIGIICQHCGKFIDRKQEGIWIPKNQFEQKRGYHISKLFSSNVSITEIMERFTRGLKNDSVLQRVYNADFGQAFTAKGAKITREMINDCLGNYRNESKFEGIGLAGIDVGNMLNIVIGYLFPDGIIRVSLIIEFPTDFDELLRLLHEYSIRVIVIDAHPEKDFVRRLKNSYKNVFSCIYSDTKKEPVDESHNLTVDRTASLDQVKEGLLSKTFTFPMNAESVPNFYDQMTSSTRVFDPKKNKGSGAYVWIESSPDHYFHALNYLSQAKRLIAAIMK